MENEQLPNGVPETGSDEIDQPVDLSGPGCKVDYSEERSKMLELKKAQLASYATRHITRPETRTVILEGNTEL